MKNICAVAALLEFLTGLALLIVPGRVIGLLLGAGEAVTGQALGRFLGIALLALGLACWQTDGRAAFRAMLAYNVLIALYLALLGTAGHFFGLALWPAVALHTILAALLLRRR